MYLKNSNYPGMGWAGLGWAGPYHQTQGDKRWLADGMILLRTFRREFFIHSMDWILLQS